MNSRDEILALLNGKSIGRVPCFSGLINITQPGLDALGLQFSEIHTDPTKLAAAAATSHELFGLESAVVPADMCVEASALGTEVDFRADVDEPMFPLVATPLAESASDFRLRLPPGLTRHPRITTVVEAIHLLKERVGTEIVVGAWVPGPLTLAAQVIELENLYADIQRAPDAVARALDGLTDALVEVAQAYHKAGAEFVTIHEMGGSPGVIGPRAFEMLLLPRLQRLLAALPAPRVLSVCGNTNRAMQLLAAAGSEALSVDEKNDLARSRGILGPAALLFGNIDPVTVLAEGDTDSVRRAVRRAVAAGVNAVWPGCDLPPSLPAENLRALVAESAASGTKKT